MPVKTVVLGSLQSFFTDRVETEAGRQHQPLLGTADGHVDPPLLVPIVDGAERGDRVDHEQSRMSGIVDGLADLGDSAGDAGRGLVMDDIDRFDGPLGVGLQFLLDDLRIGAMPPVGGHKIDFDAELAGHGAPERGEMSGLEHQYLVTGAQGIDQSRLPGTGPGSREDDDRAGGLENPPGSEQHLFR